MSIDSGMLSVLFTMCYNHFLLFKSKEENLLFGFLYISEFESGLILPTTIHKPKDLF